jgi:hypothetical protein
MEKEYSVDLSKINPYIDYEKLEKELKKITLCNTTSGIKVIENNYKKGNTEQSNHNNDNEDLPIQITCEHCNSKLEITKKDTYIGCYGVRFIKCPCCGKESAVVEMKDAILTVDNIDFPVHFHHTCKENHAVGITNEEIIKRIKEGVEYFRRHKNEEYWFTASGDTFVILFRYDEDQEYDVIVTKNYYETYIPFDDVDYVR